MKAKAMIATAAVALLAAASAGAVDSPTLADQVTCRFAKGLPSEVTANPEIQLHRNSTECLTKTYTFDGSYTLPDGRVCDHYVMVPWLRWYTGNRLDKDGTLKDGTTPYAVFRDTSTPYCDYH